MPVRFSAYTAGLKRTSGLPASTAFTITGWGCIRGSGGDALRPIFLLTDLAGGAVSFIESLAGSGKLYIINGSGGEGAELITAGTNNWFFWAISQDGTGAGAITGYAATIGSPLTSASLAGDTFTPSYMSLQNDLGASVYFWNGSVGGVKIWDAVLTQAEIEAERRQYLPVRLANLHLFSPLINTGGTSFLDYSGNGRHWTESGTVTDDVDGLPIPWKMGRHRILIPAAGGGSTTLPPTTLSPTTLEPTTISPTTLAPIIVPSIYYETLLIGEY